MCSFVWGGGGGEDITATCLKAQASESVSRAAVKLTHVNHIWVYFHGNLITYGNKNYYTNKISVVPVSLTLLHESWNICEPEPLVKIMNISHMQYCRIHSICLPICGKQICMFLLNTNVKPKWAKPEFLFMWAPILLGDLLSGFFQTRVQILVHVTITSTALKYPQGIWFASSIIYNQG